MQKVYESYTVEDFLENDSFIRWVRSNASDENDFWKRWIAGNPSNLNTMREAETQLKAILSAHRFKPNEGEATLVWERIKATIDRGGKIVNFRKWLSVAAIIIFLAGAGIYFLLNKNSTSFQKKEIAQQNDVKAPDKNKATITLADGTVVYLDEVISDTVANQNGVAVVKDSKGFLSYLTDGKSTNDEKPVFNSLNNPRGSKVINMHLSDGTEVWLNAGSSLKYPVAFTGSDRRVELTGEGYFEVAKIKNRKFLVKTGIATTEVLGTHFNISAYEEEGPIRTTLLEGKVQVINAKNTIMLNPGQQAIAKTDGKLSKENVDVEQVIAWKNGYFSFYQADLEEVMNKLARWYDLTVEYKGSVPNRVFEGEIQNDLTLAEALKILAKNKINFRIEGKKLIIMP